MKTRFLLLAAIFVLVLPAGCSEEKPSEPEQQLEEDPIAALVQYQGCKTDKDVGKYPEVAPDQDCVEYSYNPDQETLQLNHINAGFNCCPGEITADISINGDTISIVENESEYGCKCLCLFDLAYRIEDLAPGIYTISITELYLEEGDQPVEFTVDLENQQSGKECFDRDHYPWNNGYYSEEPQGFLTDYTGCKTVVTDISDTEVPPCLGCAECFYSDNILYINHINAGFNCCPEEIVSEIHIEGDTIRIREWETEGLCDCLCLFDLKYEIRNIEPGTYTVVFDEQYLCEGDDPLTFQITLPTLPNFCFCEERTCYPWETSYSEENDQERLSKMEDLIEELRTPAVCSGDSDCLALPYGDKPCGGPRKYIAASAATEDFSRLIPALCVYNSFDEVVNRRYHYVSDCMIVGKPAVECINGYCRIVVQQ